MEINDYITKIHSINQDRDWQKFHTEKNIAISISLEASELLELYLWKETIENNEIYKLKSEIGDIFYNLLNFCSIKDINIEECLKQSILKIESKYPVEKFKGSNKKYNDLY